MEAKMTKKKGGEVEVKCPDCGSTKMNLPKNIRIDEKGRVFIDIGEGREFQLHTMPPVAYICGNCKREIRTEELGLF